MLAYIAGSEERVRRADQASQLADEIVQFPPVEMDEDSLWGALKTEDLNVELDDIKISHNEGVWSYELDPFKTTIEIGDVLELSVGIWGREGSSFEHRILIEVLEEDSEVRF